jgi:hypothetical protein
VKWRDSEIHVIDTDPPRLKSRLLLSEDGAGFFSPIEPAEHGAPTAVFSPQ